MGSNFEFATDLQPPKIMLNWNVTGAVAIPPKIALFDKSNGQFSWNLDPRRILFTSYPQYIH